MRQVFKYISNKLVRGPVKRYLSQTRVYNYKGLTLTVPPQVFHPAFFFSTKFLLGYIEQLPLSGKRLLELGAGSGLISFRAAQLGAIVTASDINKTAVEYLQKNNEQNRAGITVIDSDLFNNISEQQFDIIAINPPYYKKQPAGDAEYAWYCGPNGEYFDRLFAQLGAYIESDSLVLMVFSDDGDIAMVRQKALDQGYKLENVKQKRTLWEQHFIFHVSRL